MTDRKDLGLALGEALGVLLAPLFGVGSLIRRARFLHPDGVVYRARVTPAAAPTGALGALAGRLGPAALVRLSAGWWRRGKEWPDALGVTLRFQSDPGAPPGPEDQDLLTATIPLPALTPFAPLWTDVHDFLNNMYYGTAPFWVEGVGRRRLRLRPQAPSPPRGDRAARLAAAAAQGEAVLTLEAATAVLGPWEPVVTVQLQERLDSDRDTRSAAVIDQEALRFSPFRDGKGITPAGFVQGLRRAAYAASQAARPRSRGA